MARAAVLPAHKSQRRPGRPEHTACEPVQRPKTAWSVAPQITQPIFTAGRIKSSVKFAQAQRERAADSIRKTIQTAFSEVSDGLIAHQRVRERREKQEALVAALEDRLRLPTCAIAVVWIRSSRRLDADRDLFQAELTLAQIRLDECLTVVQLYKVLGWRLAVRRGAAVAGLGTLLELSTR